MTSSDARRFDAKAPESRNLIQHRAAVRGICQLGIDAKSPAAGDLQHFRKSLISVSFDLIGCSSDLAWRLSAESFLSGEARLAAIVIFCFSWANGLLSRKFRIGHLIERKDPLRYLRQKLLRIFQ